MAYVLYAKDFQGMHDTTWTARERANDTFLSEADRRRKENLASLRAMGIIK